MCPRPIAAPIDRRRRRRSHAPRSSRRRRRARSIDPNREGLTLTVRAAAERLDVGDGVDGGVPGDAVGVRLEDRQRLVGERRVLDPGVGEGIEHPPVQGRVGRVVDHGARVLALEIDRVDAAELRSSSKIASVQSGRASSLKRSVGWPRGTNAPPWRRVAEAPERRRSPVGACVRRRRRAIARLAEGEVERGALERPAAVVDRRRGARAPRGTAQRLEVRREALDRPLPDKRQHRPASCWASWRRRRR